MNLRSLSSILGLSLVLSACGAPSPQPATVTDTPPAPVETPAPEASTEDAATKNVATLIAAYADFNDRKSVEHLWADDCTAGPFDNERPPLKGPAAITKQLVDAQLAKFPDTKIVPARIVVLDDKTILVEAVANGTHKGDLPGGVKADGKRIGDTIAHLYTFGADGKVTELKILSNQLKSFVQLGVMPPMGPNAKMPPITALPTGEPTIVKGAGDQANVDIVKKLNEASHLKKDMDAWTALLASDVAVGFPPNPDVAGADKQRKMNEPFVKAFSDEKLEFVAGYAVADHAVLIVKNTATHSGKLGPMPVTNKSFTRHYIDVVRIADGKIAAIASYHNPMTAMKQLGLFPPKGAPAKK